MNAHTDRGLNQDSLQNHIWRAVRDAGATGLEMERLQALVPARWAMPSIRTCANQMVRQRFLARKDTRRGPYIVTEDCRVPVGEDPHLGPGFDDAAPAMPPSPTPAEEAVPGETNTGRVAVSSSVAASTITAPLAIDSSALAAHSITAPAPHFRCALDSDGVLLIQSGTMNGTLGRDDVRRLVEYLCRFDGFGVRA
jgi:hypothetical protein